jgi:hypothetical protein
MGIRKACVEKEPVIEGVLPAENRGAMEMFVWISRKVRVREREREREKEEEGQG